MARETSRGVVFRQLVHRLFAGQMTGKEVVEQCRMLKARQEGLFDGQADRRNDKTISPIKVLGDDNSRRTN